MFAGNPDLQFWPRLRGFVEVPDPTAWNIERLGRMIKRGESQGRDKRSVSLRRVEGNNKRGINGEYIQKIPKKSVERKMLILRSQVVEKRPIFTFNFSLRETQSQANGYNFFIYIN